MWGLERILGREPQLFNVPELVMDVWLGQVVWFCKIFLPA